MLIPFVSKQDRDKFGSSFNRSSTENGSGEALEARGNWPVL
jgi:hypothetical protein